MYITTPQKPVPPK